MAAEVPQMLVIFCLGVLFLATPSIAAYMDSLLDTLPIRLAALIALLAIVAYDKVIALGLFMVIMAVYIQHHQDDLMSVVGVHGSPYKKSFQNSDVMAELDGGGHADETYDTADFVPKDEDQDHDFHRISPSIDEKHALNTEHLGTRSQSLFPEDAIHATRLEDSNRNGHHD